MSEFEKTTRDASTYQKLPLPKSLRGQRDAEVTWDMIVKRYPNAAPLLCEMENVIERAEGLLRQLRSPYTHPLERSSSFQIADSEDQLGIIPESQTVEESTEVSIISEQDSRMINFSTETPVNISESKISGVERREESISFSDNQNNCFLEDEEAAVYRDVETVASFDSEETNVVYSEMNNSSIVSSSVVNLIESENSLEVGKSRSLEAWSKVVGEKTSRSSSSKSAKAVASGSKEDTVSEHTRRLTSLKSGPMQEITKLNILGKKEEMMQRFAGTIATATKIIDCTTRFDMENNREMISVKIETNVEGNVIAKDTESVKNPEVMETALKPTINETGERKYDEKVDFRVDETSEDSIVETKVKGDDRVGGEGDEYMGMKIFTESQNRSSIEILDEYSKICEHPVEYKYLSSNSSYNKTVIVKCSMGGFAFEACADTKKSAKITAAAKLLRCLTGRQIDGEITTNLIPLTRKQIEEIIRLGNGGEHETAIRKLYKICLEENAPEPVYSTVQQSTSIHGNRYTVKCEALGYTTSGFGIRILIAKRVAADELLRAYHKARNPVDQI